MNYSYSPFRDEHYARHMDKKFTLVILEDLLFLCCNLFLLSAIISNGDRETHSPHMENLSTIRDFKYNYQLPLKKNKTNEPVMSFFYNLSASHFFICCAVIDSEVPFRKSQMDYFK